MFYTRKTRFCRPSDSGFSHGLGLLYILRDEKASYKLI